jgi:hypothetical protein
MNKPNKKTAARKSVTKGTPKVAVAPGCSEDAIYGITRGVMAVKAREESVQKALDSGKVDTEGVDVDLLGQFDSGEWTLAHCGLLLMEASVDLSRILKTQAVHLFYESTSGSIGYHIYEGGALVEILKTADAEFMEFMEEGGMGPSVGNPLCNVRIEHDGVVVWLESRLVRATKKALAQGAAKFVNLRFKELGIGVPEKRD